MENMSLPTSEPLPDDINELPPARQRHIRRRPQSSSLAERQILLESVIQLTSPSINYFLLGLLGAITLGIAIYFDEPLLLLAALVILPFLTPVFVLALLPATLKWSQVFKSLVSLMLLLFLTFTSGALAGWLQKTPLINIQLDRFSTLNWLDLAVVIIATIVAVVILLRKGNQPKLVGVLLTCEILLPLAASGLAFLLGVRQLWPGALLVSLIHLGLAIIIGVITFFILGFPPKRFVGWLLILLLSALVAGMLVTKYNLKWAVKQPALSPSPTSILSLMPSQTASPKAVSTKTSTLPQPTQTITNTSTVSPSPTITLTPTITPTPLPTTYWVVVNSSTGAVLRESPGFDAPVINYVNNGDTIEIFDALRSQDNRLWLWVRTQSGERGWLLGSLVNTQTPTTTAN